MTFIHQPDDFLNSVVKKMETSIVDLYTPFAKKYGLEFEFLASRSVVPAVSDAPRLWCNGVDLLSEPQCFLLEQTSTMASADRYLRGIYEVIDASDSVLLNRTTRVRDFAEHDKIGIANCARLLDIPYLPSLVVPFGKYAINVLSKLDTLGAEQWILKPREMAMGRAVLKFSDRDQLRSALDLVGQSHHSYLLQPYVKCVGDLRVYTVDGKVVTSQMREPESGRVIANTSRGAHSSVGHVDSRLREMCELICRRLGARYLCIDWLITPDGPILNEWCTALGGFKSLPEPDRSLMADSFFKFIDREIESREVGV